MPKFTWDFPIQLNLLRQADIEAIHQTAIKILSDTGVLFECAEALEILEHAGCLIEEGSKIARFPAEIVRDAILSAPESFYLYSRGGERAVLVGKEAVEIVPSVSASNIMIGAGDEVRAATALDLKDLTVLESRIPEYRLLAPAVVCSDVEPVAGDAYRNYIMLKNTDKPFISEAWGVEGVEWTNRLLVALRGSQEEAAAKPVILLGLCPMSPLSWSYEAAQNLIDATRLGIPINICACPILGSASPVTIAGAVAQQAAEFLSGLVLAQAIKPGFPVVFGGYSTSFDMKTTVSAMTAIEAMLAVTAHGALAKYYGVPSQTFAACSEGKTLDYQSGWETAMTGVIAAAAGINLIYGPGSADYLMSFSYEKLLIDAEIAKECYRFAKGIAVNEDSLALDAIQKVGPGGSFLTAPHTLKRFREEQTYLGKMIDRTNRETWVKMGKPTLVQKAQKEVEKLLAPANQHYIAADPGRRLDEVIEQISREAAIDLPLF